MLGKPQPAMTRGPTTRCSVEQVVQWIAGQALSKSGYRLPEGGRFRWDLSTEANIVIPARWEADLRVTEPLWAVGELSHCLPGNRAARLHRPSFGQPGQDADSGTGSNIADDFPEYAGGVGSGREHELELEVRLVRKRPDEVGDRYPQCAHRTLEAHVFQGLAQISAVLQRFVLQCQRLGAEQRLAPPPQGAGRMESE